MVKVDLIIFDLDGTLIDSSSDIIWSANKTLLYMGYRERRPEEIKKCIGWGVKRLLEQLMPEEDEDAIEGARNKFLEYYWDHLTVETILYPGVRETMEFLRSRNKKIALVTNKPLRFTERILQDLSISPFFSIIIGGDSLPNRKPHPEPALKVLETLNVSPPEGMMVGDSPVDCETGRGAGMKTVGVTYGFRDRETLIQAGFDFIIDDLRMLIDIIQ